MTPIQQMYLGLGAKTKTYLDDVFGNYLYRGDGASTKTITNGINLAGDGGLTWIKNRDATQDHVLVDTVRGATKKLHTNKDNGQATDSTSLKSFTSTGFTVGSNNEVNNSSNDYVSWSFKKSKGFFDCISYTGNGSNRTIAHNLGSVPGFYIIKRTDSTSNSDWVGFHKDFWGANYYAVINSTAQMVSESDISNNTKPTSSTFSVGTDSKVNVDGGSYICYLFAGGPSTATTANSCGFNNSNYLYPAASTDFAFGTGDFTIECWVQSGSVTSDKGVFQLSATSGGISTGSRLTLSHTGTSDSNKWELYLGTGSNKISTVETLDTYQWYHVAVVRSSGVIKLYVNGVERAHSADTTDYTFQNLAIGGYYNTSSLWEGKISNFRVVKGTAVYTSSFKPPTEPLTNITNTKLLCCQSSTSATAAAVSPTTITNSNSVTARTESPFDDSAAYIFGEEGNQSIIKCGTFSTTSSSPNTKIDLGWEPQWVMTKKIDGTSNWNIWDTMRGWTVPGDPDSHLEANDDAEDYTPSDYGGPHPNGFHINGVLGYSGEGIYIAIRRLDGYVSKPADAGTDVFAMDAGAGGSTIPNYDTGFPVDMAIDKIIGTDSTWYLSGRLTGTNYLKPDSNGSQLSHANYTWDSNVGWGNGSWQDSTYQSWMFRRGQGFDVSTYVGNADTLGVYEWQNIPHNLGRTPEMVWVRRRDGGAGTQNWFVYHKDLSHTSSTVRNIYLDSNASEGSGTSIWNDTLPDAKSFTVGGAYAVNLENKKFIALLFASIEGISKCGSYDGSSSSQTITTGFQPRFVIIKRIDGGSYPWVVLDTTRGWGSGDDKWLQLNDTSEQSTHDMGAPTSTGFTLTGGSGATTYVNENTNKYIYYAHA